MAGLYPEVRKTTWMNPTAHPRVVIDVPVGVTAGRTVGILNVGVPVRAPGNSTQPRVAVPVAKTPTAVGGVTKTPNAVPSAPQSPDRVQGVAPDAGDDAIAIPASPADTVARPAAPAPRIVGKTKR